MRRKKNRFLDILESYVTEYMPYAAGLSANTIRSYKDTFRLLLAYLQEEKGIAPHKATFAGLDYDTLAGFLDWLEQARKSSVSTRNQRLTILAAFAAYAQNRDFDAASVFMNSIQKNLRQTHPIQAPDDIYNGGSRSPAPPPGHLHRHWATEPNDLEPDVRQWSAGAGNLRFACARCAVPKESDTADSHWKRKQG